ncbi:hypothetical protein ABN273_19750 [Nonomuraea sp. B19D2]
MAWQIAAVLVSALALLVIVNVGMPEPLRVTLLIVDVAVFLVFFGLLVATALRQHNG